MNQKQLITLLVLVALIGGAGLYLYNARRSSYAESGTAAGGKLMGNLPVNDITRITIKHETNGVDLVKKDDLWRVAERQDYPANFVEISQLLLKLRDLKIVQTEKVGASQLPRLQLAPGQGTNSPMVIEFKGAGDKPIQTLLVGKAHMKKSAGRSGMGDDEGWPDGRYVKVGGSDDVAVINDPLEQIQTRPEDWLDKDFIKVEKARSVEVDFPVATHSWKLTRETESGEWQLADAKPDEKLDSTKTVSVSHPLGNPSFSDVLPGDQLEGTGTNAPVVVKIGTFEDFHYTIHVGQKTNENYPVTVAVTAVIPKERIAGTEEKPEDKAKLDKEFKDREQKLEDKLKQEQSFASWTYLVAGWTIEPLLKERAQLLAEQKEEPEKNGETPAGTEEETAEPKAESTNEPAAEPVETLNR